MRTFDVALFASFACDKFLFKNNEKRVRTGIRIISKNISFAKIYDG